MNGLIATGCGVLTLALAVSMVMNTSMGGTRSDYDDGSGCVAVVGAVLLVVGLAISLFEVIS
jgi:hypothetical protein